jgi:hypothetical protein
MVMILKCYLIVQTLTCRLNAVSYSSPRFLLIYLFILGEFIGNPSLKSFNGIDHNFHIQLRILA